ncbi:Alpha/Beta hydrolase protein [Mycena crocata]|nr:Alpha/Beta hydrolase protein [Mycena crocata]
MPSSSVLVAVLGFLALGADAVLHLPNSRARTKATRRPTHPKPRADPSTFQYLTNTTAKYAVNGTNIPLYDGDVGESYAGLLPIADEYRVNPNGTDTRALFFWFFPSTNPAASDEITIWLTGGPGCSSLVASLQENGPFVWGPGTEGPRHNPWSWNRLTNIVYIEQPVGVGFSQGTPGLLVDETDVAKEFLGWWKNFVEAFALQGRKVYITGESYAGYYIPYIADAMLNAVDTQFFNLEATLLVNAVIGEVDLQQQVPHQAMVKEFPHLFPINKTYEAVLSALDDHCGYTSFLNEYLIFPPKGAQPVVRSSTVNDGECDLYINSIIAASYLNPCLYPYELGIACPYPVDPMRNPTGGTSYFNRADVKAALNAPLETRWIYCKDPTFANDNTDLSPAPIYDVLPRVIERLNKTLIVTGALDLVLPSNGTLLAIQNMTWSGARGFQTAPALGFHNLPTDEDADAVFFVPYTGAEQDFDDIGGLAGAGVMGTQHAERGLTFVEVVLAGHQLPTWQPAAAFRHLEYLLGRAKSLSDTEEGWSMEI